MILKCALLWGDHRAVYFRDTVIVQVMLAFLARDEIAPRRFDES